MCDRGRVPAPRPPRASRSRQTSRRHRPRGQAGQASADYVAVVAIVTLALVVTATAVAAPSIVNGVGAGFQRALCRVTGEGCAVVDTKPCVVRNADSGVRAGVKVTFLRIGRNVALLRSVSSDGTVSLTLLDRVDAGLTAGVGASGRLQLGGLNLSGGAVAQVALVGGLGGGRTWRLKDTEEADRLQRKLIEVVVGRTTAAVPIVGPALHAAQSLLDVGSGRDLPEPDTRTLNGALSVSATLKGPVAGELVLAAGATLAGTRGRDGSRSVVLALEAGPSGRLAAGLAGLGLKGAVKVQVTFDRDGRATELELGGEGEASAFAKLQGGAGRTGGGADERAQSAELTASLDLTVPAHLQAARRLLRALAPGRQGELLGAAFALGRVVSRSGRLELTRRGRQEDQYAVGAEAALGAGVGAELEVTRTDSTLLDALTRPAGGVWERRADCLDRV